MKTARFPDGTEVPALGQGTWKMADDPGCRADEIAALREGIGCGIGARQNLGNRATVALTLTPNGSKSLVSFAFTGTNPIWARPCRERLALPAQSHQPFGHERINGSVNRRHHVTPTRCCQCRVRGGERSGHFARTDRCPWCSGGEHRQGSPTRIDDRLHTALPS